MSRSACRLIWAAIVVSCADRDAAPGAAGTPSCDDAGVRTVVEQLGARMKNVSLLAPDSVMQRQLRTEYTGLVTAGLLERWLAEPARAPGREVSSPWPEHIAIRAVRDTSNAACVVEADVAYATSVEQISGGAAARAAVMIVVTNVGGWRISAYESAASPEDPAASTARDVVQRYYDAIAARDYAQAYALWEGDGSASGHTLEAFTKGVEPTDSVEVEIGEPGRIVAAAGSRYVHVPVVIHWCPELLYAVNRRCLQQAKATHASRIHRSHSRSLWTSDYRR